MTHFARSSVLSAATTVLVSAAFLAAPPPALAEGPRAVRCAGQVATIVGTPGHDTLVGTPHRDVIVGRGGADIVRGRGGNDLICGGPGADHLRGDRGNDTLRGGPGADRLEGNAGGDTLRGDDGRDRMDAGGSGSHRVDRLLADRGNDVLVAHRHSDVVDYSHAHTRVHANLGRGTGTVRGHWSGHDRLVFRHGRSVFVGSDHDDMINAARGTAAVSGGRGNDLITGTHTRGGALRGGPGDDRLKVIGNGISAYGGAGDDTVSYVGVANISATLSGGAGRDRIAVRLTDPVEIGDVTVDLSLGRLTTATVRARVPGFEDATIHDDRIASLSPYAYHVSGTEDPNDLVLDIQPRSSLDGGASRGVLDGLGGDDTLTGGGGDDTLTGGVGNDTLQDGVAGSSQYGYETNVFVADPGDDTWIVNPFDELSYETSEGPVAVDLSSGRASGVSIGHDTLELRGPIKTYGFYVAGTETGGDTIIGSPGGDHIYAAGSHDSIEGRDGNDTIQFGGFSTVSGGNGDDLLNGTYLYQADHDGSIAHGGPGNDSVGVGPHGQAYGDDGDDSITYSPSADSVADGGTGTNGLNLDLERDTPSTAPYKEVRVDLAAGTVTADATSFLPIHGFTNLAIIDFGTPQTEFAQSYVVLGTDAPNFLALYSLAAGPTASLYGLSGDDTLAGGDGDDLLDGGAGLDRGNGGGGNDTCVSVELPFYDGQPNVCETVQP